MVLSSNLGGSERFEALFAQLHSPFFPAPLYFFLSIGFYQWEDLMDKRRKLSCTLLHILTLLAYQFNLVATQNQTQFSSINDSIHPFDQAKHNSG
jgi:hypothetical protein